jgi:hypothetical protein
MFRDGGFCRVLSQGGYMSFFTLFLILLAALFKAFVYRSFKKETEQPWEIRWLCFCLLAMIIIPHLWFAFSVNPLYFKLLRYIPIKIIAGSFLCGIAWGAGYLWLHRKQLAIGYTLSYAIHFFTAVFTGIIGPVILLKIHLGPAALVFLGLLLFLTLTAVILLTFAALLRDKATVARGNFLIPHRRLKMFLPAVGTALLIGIGFGLQNIGFSLSLPVDDNAFNHQMYTSGANLLAWIFIIWGCFAANIIYIVIRLAAGKTPPLFRQKLSLRFVSRTAVSAALWFSAYVIYARTVIIARPFGIIIGWIIFNNLTLLFDNLVQVKEDEWQQHNAVRTLWLTGHIMLIMVSFLAFYLHYQLIMPLLGVTPAPQAL